MNALPDSFAIYLKEELSRRKAKNSSYSLRSFGKALGVNHSGLSQVMRGKRPITEKMVRKLGEKLNLGPFEVRHFLNQLREKQENPVYISENQLSLDSFAVISDWYHLAILEMTKLDDFESDPKYIAKKLGISEHDCKLALERLVRLKIIGVNEEGEIQNLTPGHTDSTHHTFTTTAKKKFQKQTFELAGEAIDQVDIANRCHSGMTLAMNSKQMDKAKKLINEFKWKFSQLMLEAAKEGTQDEQPSFDSVYHLSLGLFPMTSLEGANKTEGENHV